MSPTPGHVGADRRSLTICVVYPDLLGTYGDGGNGVVLARRASWRGIDAELLYAASDRPLPAADLYTVGGGEDGPQVRAARTLIEDGTSVVGPGARPLATVEHGVGNGGGDGTEGAWSGRVLGTYLHGPVLARNTALADLLLGWALAPDGSPPGTVAELEPLDDFEELALRSERLEAADVPEPMGWRGLVERVRRGR